MPFIGMHATEMGYGISTKKSVVYGYTSTIEVLRITYV